MAQGVINPVTVCSSSLAPGWATAGPVQHRGHRLCVGRKKELIVGPHLSVRRRGKRGTQAAAAAALGQRPAHAGEGRRGEGDGLRCGLEGEGEGEGA